jgi:hypothetical protein
MGASGNVIKLSDRRLDSIQSMGWTVELDCNSITISKGEEILFFDGGDYIEKAIECVVRDAGSGKLNEKT